MVKIESRLEANPQCKEVINPKTGSTMPCPDLDKMKRPPEGVPSAIAVPVTAPTPPTSSSSLTEPSVSPSSLTAPAANVVPRSQPTPPCKPQVNTKTGAVMPCPG